MTSPSPTPTSSPTRTGSPTRTRQRRYSLGGNSALSMGVVVLWVSILVALPIAALFTLSLTDGPAGFVAAVTERNALLTLGLTVGLAAVVSLVNAVMGTIIAWVLVRDDFPGKRVLDSIIDIPFALPSIVASIVLLSLYGPDSPVGITMSGTRMGVLMALAFVTLPFVVRQVQPVLKELDREAEEAAASLGANAGTIFARIIWPALLPAVASGTGLSFARAVGEFGSVVMIGGNIPGRTQVASQYIQQLIEVGDQAGAAAVSVVLLAISFVVLSVLRLVAARAHGHEEVA